MASTWDEGKAPAQAWSNKPPLGKRRLSKQNKSTTRLNALNTSFLQVDTSGQQVASPSSASSEALLSSPLYENRSPYGSRQQLRDHIFTEPDSTISTDAIEVDPSERYTGAPSSRGFKQKMVRTGTMITKHATIRLPLGLSKASSRLSLVESLDDEDAVFNEIREKALTDSTKAYHHTSEPKSTTASRAPIRRRSLFTPGLATRNPEDPLRKPPAPTNPEQDFGYDAETELLYYYNPGLSESSPLERLAALDLAESRHGTPAPRSSTPADLDYGLLGAGLRITNGVASPMSSVRSTMYGSRTSTPRPYHRESFYAAIEGDTGLDDIRPPSEVFHLRAPAASPLRAMQSARSFGQETDSKKSLPNSSSSSSGHRRANSSTLAMEYMADLPSTPFASTVDINKPLPFLPTTKANEIEDELFEDNTATPSPVSERSLDPWRQQLSEDESLGRDSDASEVESLSTIDRMASKESMSQDYSVTPSQLTTSTQSGTTTHTAWTTSSNEDASVTTTTTTTSAPAVSVMRTTVSTQLRQEQNAGYQRRPNISPADSGYYSAGSSKDGQQTTPKQVAPVTLTPAPLQREPSGFQAISYDSLVTSGTPAKATRPSLAPASKFSDETIKTMSSGRGPERNAKRLQKKSRPSSMPPPLDRVALHRDLEGGGAFIPPVPMEVAVRHAERSRAFPPLQYTVPHPSHSRSRSDFQMPIPVSEPLQFPSPAPPKNERMPRRIFSGRILNFTSDSSREGQQKRASLQDFSMDEVNGEYGPAITHFGDVADSLGDSPYDAASMPRPTAYGPRRNERVHPHHMTGNLPKSKSMAGMNEAQAAEMNRVRGYYRMSAARAEASNTRANVASPCSDVPPGPATVPMDVYLPGRLDEHDKKWHNHARSATMSDAPWRPQPPNSDYRPEEMRTYEGAMPAATPPPRNATMAATHPARRPPRLQTAPDWGSHGAAWAQRRMQADPEFCAPPHSASALELRSRRPPELVSPLLPLSKETSNGSPRESPAEEKHRDWLPPISAGGRFDGGFAYGYEPGRGIGGSAGTRGGPASGGASRKSVAMGRQYGIDLSDVPIFVAPAVST